MQTAAANQEINSSIRPELQSLIQLARRAAILCENLSSHFFITLDFEGQAAIRELGVQLNLAALKAEQQRTAN